MLVAFTKTKVENKGGSNLSLIILTIYHIKYEGLTVIICLKSKQLIS